MFFKQFIAAFNQNIIPVRYERSFRGLKKLMERQGLVPFSEDDQAFNRLFFSKIFGIIFSYFKIWKGGLEC